MLEGVCSVRALARLMCYPTGGDTRKEYEMVMEETKKEILRMRKKK